MKRYVVIHAEEELHKTWTDPALPHMSFTFNEEWIDECQPLSGDIYVATYHTYEVLATSIINYYDATSSSYKSVTVEPGEYGLRSGDTGLTEAEYQIFLRDRLV